MNRYSRVVQRWGHRPWFAALGRRMVPVDRWIQRVSGGRFTAIGRHGLPALLLTTIGRRTGEPRTQPLLYAPDGDGYVVIGSNWGQPHHPLWTENLLRQRDATVTVDGVAAPVRATLATGAERDRLWRLLSSGRPMRPTRAGRPDASCASSGYLIRYRWMVGLSQLTMSARDSATTGGSRSTYRVSASPSICVATSPARRRA